MTNKIKPALIFQDSMILQRGKPIRVWGTCEEDMEITVRIEDSEVTVGSEKGKWIAILPPMKECENTELEIFSETEHITLTNVAIGEVWIAGGQSNMEFYLRYDEARKEAKANPHIRMFDYPEISYEGQLEKYDYSEFGFWRECTEENLDYFTAVGYYFALQLEETYHVPIGIIGCNWGGTPACAWMDASYLKSSEGKIWVGEYEQELQNLDLSEYDKEFTCNPANYRGKPFENVFQEKMMYGMSEEEFSLMIQSFFTDGAEIKPPVIGPKSESRPGGLYETMVKKIAPYTVRGVLWYQGENDDKHADVYDTVLERLIACWRNTWKDELPFLIVQLAPFEYWTEEGRTIFPTLRKKQEWVSEHVPDVWMASIMDAGMKKDIHPKKKKVVGERLALLARGHVYGEKILCDAPKCERLTVEEGKIALHFKNAGEGMTGADSELRALEVLADEKKIRQMNFDVKQNVLEIYADEIKIDSEITVKFAEQDYCEVNLFSSIGLPSVPFTIRGKKTC